MNWVFDPVATIGIFECIDSAVIGLLWASKVLREDDMRRSQIFISPPKLPDTICDVTSPKVVHQVQAEIRT